MLEIEHVTKCLHLGGVVVKHQQHAGISEDDKEVKSNPSHAPGIAVAHGVAIDFGRVQMQENVGKHAQRAVARCVIVLVAED